MPEIVVDYTAPPTVRRFLKSDAPWRCIMGPVGSGKSSGCNVEILRRALQQERGPDGIRRSRWVVIRNTYPELRDTTRKTFEQWVPSHLGKWNEQQFTFTMRFDDVHAEVLFRALDHPDDKKKLLSLELTGAYINEMREVSKEVIDLLDTRIGRYPSKREGGPSWFGIWMDTNPWDESHWAEKHFKGAPEGHELHVQPDGLGPDAENVENLPDGYYTRLCVKKDSSWIDTYARGKVAKSTVGSIFGEWVAGLVERGRISDFRFSPIDIYTSWDLGVGDTTAIWFWKLAPEGVDVVDHYENHGKGLSHYFEVLKEKGYSYKMHWLPHDARARTLQTGVSTLELVADALGRAKVSITPHLDVDDGIAAGRWLMEQNDTRIHASNCALGVEMLRAYKFKWNPATMAFSKQPLHNLASNTADAWRYTAVVVRQTADSQPKPPPKPIKNLTHYQVTLDELWSMQQQEESY